MVADFDTLYQFIPGADAADNARYRPSSQDQLAKVNAFRVTLTDVRDIMIQELAAVDRSVSSPAKEARKHIDTFRKTIKKREDRKVGVPSVPTLLLIWTIAGLGTLQESHGGDRAEEHQIRAGQHGADEASNRSRRV
jgi:hypothetical protein